MNFDMLPDIPWGISLGHDFHYSTPHGHYFVSLLVFGFEIISVRQYLR